MFKRRNYTYFEILKLYFKLNILKIKKFGQIFIFNGNKYRYFYHLYNNSWENERSVEVPIILKIIKEYQRKNILEIGNVLSHYFPVKHDVLDKYEKGKYVINQDIVSFRPQKKYDLIVSISTLEHVGWDEKPRYPRKLIRAINNLRRLLSPKGEILLTFPLGYNCYVDKLYRNGKLKLSKSFFLKKISIENDWREENVSNVNNILYNHPFPGANGLIIGFIE